MGQIEINLFIEIWSRRMEIILKEYNYMNYYRKTMPQIRAGEYEGLEEKV